MGKSNRIRTNRANAPVHAPRASKPQNKKGLSSRAMSVIALIVTIAILLMVVSFVLIGKGVPNRLIKSVESDNFAVDTNMMSYYFYTVYSDFVNNYNDYMSYFSLDTSKSLKDQKFGGDGTKTYYDASFLGAFEGTWFDFFAEQTKNEVSSMLLYLEEANARGISLTDEEKDEISASLDSTVASYGYTGNADAYFSMQYGKGVCQKDIQKAIEYSTLASKVQNVIYDELVAWVDANPGEIDTKYAADKKAFDVIDYTYYSFRINYEDLAKEILGDDYQNLLKDNEENKTKVLDAYKQKIADSKAKAEALVAITDEKELKSAILDIVLGEAYDDTYKSLKAADKKESLTDEDLAAIRTGMIAEIIADKLEEKTDSTEEKPDSIKITEETKKNEEGKDEVVKTATAYGKTVPVAFAEILEDLKETIEPKATSALSSYVVEKETYSEDSEFSKWAYETGRAAGETKIITEGDGKNDEITSDTGYTYITAYVLKNAPHKDEEKTRNAVYALFSSETSAKAAITALTAKEGLDATAFEEIVKANGTTGNAKIEDYQKGMMGNAAFDEWLLDKKLTVGAFTKTPLSLDESTFAVALYTGEGELNWKVSVKNTILSEKQTAQYEDMEAKYGDSIEVNDRAINRIKA